MFRFGAAVLMAALLLWPGLAWAQAERTGAEATADFWAARASSAVLLDAEAVARENEAFVASGEVRSLVDFPAELSGAEVRARMLAAMEDFSAEELPEVYAGEELLGEADWRRVRENAGLSALPERVAVRYAVTTGRVNLRVLPTAEGWYDEPGDVNYDDLQATVLDPGEAVAVLAESVDKKFFFVSAEDYEGWAAAELLAFTGRNRWESFAAPEDFAVVTTNRKSFGERLYQLGAVLPLDGEGRLLLPSRGADGTLTVERARTDFDDALHHGAVPCSRENFIRLAFTCLGDEYGWGGQNESVDCSSLVQDVYHAMGLRLPRNADAQERALPFKASMEGLSRDERLTALGAAEPGDLLFKRGHVMMLVGHEEDGTPIVIHSASSFVVREAGQLKKQSVRRVMVSDLTYLGGGGVATVDALRSFGGVR